MIGAAFLTAALAGCGGSSNAASGGSGSGGGKQAGSLSITEPKDGASVQAPFTLTFNPGVAIGPEDSGKDHVHVILDGKTDNYTVVRTTSYQIKSLSPGKHTIGVTLQHADHSPVGPTAQITVDVTGSGSGNTGNDTGNGRGDGGGYGGGGY